MDIMEELSMRNTNETNIFVTRHSKPKYNIFESLDNFKMTDIKILIAEDNDINSNHLYKILSGYGIICDIAKNADETIHLFETNDYDLLMIDYLMPPGINGIETVKQIRTTSEKGKHQLIIGMSSTTAESITNEFHSTDVDIILSKPINPNQLATILKREFPNKVL